LLFGGAKAADCYNIRVKTKSRIFLVGMMGAGKTTVGRQLAKRLGKTFHDADRDVEERTGVSVAVIFEIEGEAGFRKREAEAIEQLTALDDIVLATGGGAVLDSRNREHLKSRGFVIYLHALPAVLWHRTRADKSRPLLQGGDPRERLEAIYGVRDPLYREVADLVVDTGRQGIGPLVSQVLSRFDEACRLSA
jgi:shikimate kinase